jgi:hypothetical protein
MQLHLLQQRPTQPQLLLLLLLLGFCSRFQHLCCQLLLQAKVCCKARLPRGLLNALLLLLTLLLLLLLKP